MDSVAAAAADTVLAGTALAADMPVDTADLTAGMAAVAGMAAAAAADKVVAADTAVAADTVVVADTVAAADTGRTAAVVVEQNQDFAYRECRRSPDLVDIPFVEVLAKMLAPQTGYCSCQTVLVEP